MGAIYKVVHGMGVTENKADFFPAGLLGISKRLIGCFEGSGGVAVRHSSTLSIRQGQHSGNY